MSHIIDLYRTEYAREYRIEQKSGIIVTEKDIRSRLGLPEKPTFFQRLVQALLSPKAHQKKVNTIVGLADAWAVRSAHAQRWRRPDHATK